MDEFQLDGKFGANEQPAAHVIKIYKSDNESKCWNKNQTILEKIKLLALSVIFCFLLLV